jgi:ABC-2 type transport system permease protein
MPTGFSRFAITVSTAADQTAVAPGTLIKEWQENGRRYFRYEAPEPILNFWSLQSARYTMAKDRWKGVDLAVYHHPQHGAQVPRMMEAMKRALEYCTAAFGPYQHKNLRIVEFPHGNFAQSFANTVPYAEMIGFIADPVELANFDVVTLVTAHETAHQWFAHQIISSDVPGSTFLSETLAEYAALMVMEKQFGRERIGHFLKYELDRYFADRGADGAAVEKPLAEVTTVLPHVAYQKGGHAMYALSQVIGETAVNKVLAEFIRKYRFKSDPYPTAKDLVTALRAAAGPEYQGLITDLFERIVTWDFAIEEAVSRPTANGQWETTVTFTSAKYGQSSDGRSETLPLDEPVELMLSEYSPSTYTLLPVHILKRQRFRVKDDTMTVTMITPTKPAFVAVNPDLTLLQRLPAVSEVD